MGLHLHLLATLLVLMKLWSEATGQNPDGDSLYCIECLNWYNTISCLGGTLTDQNPGIDGRPHKAGDLYPTYCEKKPEEIWVVKEENGIKTLRLKSDLSQCLTLEHDDRLLPRMTPCNPSNLAQSIIFEPKTPKSYDPQYNIFEIYTNATGRELMHDLKWNRIHKFSWGVADTTKVDGSRTFGYKWVWVSEIEQKAAASRDTRFVFPIRGLTNPNRQPYLYAFTEQTMYSTPGKPLATITKTVCASNLPGSPDDACYPIDYNLTGPGVTIETSLDLALNISIGNKIYDRIGNQNQVPSGAYLKAWIPVEIQVGAFDQNKVDIIARTSLRWDQKSSESWWRPPTSMFEQVLQPGYNRMRSPYGGVLTFKVTGLDPSATTPLKITISNAVPMTTFVLGKTTEADWANEVQKEPRWIVWQGEHFAALDVKGPYAKASYKDMLGLVKRYDLLVKNHYLLHGYDLDLNDPTNIYTPPKGWTWWTRDQVSCGCSGYNGNPIVANKDGDYDMCITNWHVALFAHEHGHNMHSQCWHYAFGAETTTSINTVFNQAYFNDWKYYYDYLEQEFVATKQAIAAGKTYDQMRSEIGAWTALSFWTQMAHVFGYDIIRQLNRQFRQKVLDPNDKICSGDNFAKFDATYEILCSVTQRDLTKHFDTYKIPLSDAVRQRVAAAAYPQPDVDISSVVIPKDTTFRWLANGTTPSYALPDFSTFTDLQFVKGKNY